MFNALRLTADFNEPEINPLTYYPAGQSSVNKLIMNVYAVRLYHYVAAVFAY